MHIQGKCPVGINVLPFQRRECPEVSCGQTALPLCVNWEIWIESGERALPRRLAITYTGETNFPRSLVEFSHWNLRENCIRERWAGRLRRLRRTPWPDLKLDIIPPVQ
jgi:hypothetical protein